MSAGAMEAWSSPAAGLGGEGLSLLAQSVRALGTGADLGAAAAVSGDCLLHALEASACRLLRAAPRSGALAVIGEDGLETPYAAEPGGAIEWVARNEQPLYDDGALPGGPTREALLWGWPPKALATVPLRSRHTAQGYLLVAFDRPRRLGPAERVFLQTLADVLGIRLEREQLRAERDEARRHCRALEDRSARDEDAAQGLVAAMAEAMGSPVSSIQAYVRTLRATLENPRAPRERYLDTIQEDCARLAGLLGELTELARLEAGRRPLRVETVELRALVLEVLASLRPLIARKRLEADVDLPTGLPVEADPGLLRNLWTGLLGEAVRHSPQGSRIRLEARGEPEAWTASVSDRGPALDAAGRPRYFDRFSRVRVRNGGDDEGAGLGPSIARAIVELHGGTIEVESPAGEGCLVRFRLPLRQVAPPRARRLAGHLLERADMRGLLGASLELAAAAAEAEAASLMLVDPQRGDLFVHAALGADLQELVGRRVPIRAGVAGTVAALGRPVRVENIETDRRFRRLNHPQYATKSLLCVPLRVDGEVLGVYNLNDKRSREPFSEDDLSVAAVLVDRVGSVVERGHARAGARAVDEALDSVRSLIAMRREGVLGSVRIVRWARAVGRELEMPPAEVDVMGYLASVHDIGMTRLAGLLPDPGQPLEAGDRQLLMQHPEVGVEMLRPLEYLGAVRDAVLAHHEWWDGTGYPRGRRGEEIPLQARILAVVDAYESMTQGRPRRPALSHDGALAELERCAGRQFDPQVVGAFARVLKAERGLP